MVISLRSAVGIATIWLAAVAGVSATAWFAIDRAGRDITDASVSTLPGAPLNTPTLGSQPTETDGTPTPSATPTRVATPTPSATPTLSPTPATPATATATPQNRTISVAGGLVSVRCTGAAIELTAAQPENEWRVHVDTSGTGQIALSFQSGDEEAVSRTQVTAVCADGTPAFKVTNRSPR
jgi:hypothetical protein